MLPLWLCPSRWYISGLGVRGNARRKTSRLTPAPGLRSSRCVRVPWVKADDVVMAFHIFPPLVLPVAEIGAHIGNGKIFVAAVQRGHPVILAGDQPPLFVKGGLHGKLVMLKGQIGFGGSVIGVLRA